MVDVRVVVGAIVAIAGCRFHAPSNVVSDDDAAAIGDGAKLDDVPDNCEQPAAHWRFDDGTGAAAIDSSGHGNTLTLMTNAGWASGQSGTALALPGNSYATLPYNATFAAVRQISVTAWINPVSVSTTGAIVVKSARLGPLMDWGFYQEGPEAMFIDNFPTPDIRGTTTGMGIPAGTWTHVAFVLDVDAGTTAFYKDGMFHSTRPMTMELLQNNGEPITVGTDGGNTANDFIGSLDEITVWTRVLKAPEIAAIFAGSSCIDR